MAGFGNNVIVKLLRRLGGVVRRAGSYKVQSKSQSVTSDRKQPAPLSACNQSLVVNAVDQICDSVVANCIAADRNCSSESQAVTTDFTRCHANTQPTCRNR